MFSIDIDLMQPGDIVFTAENSLTSKLVRAFTSSEYSHVLLCVGYGSCIHADKKGGVHSFNVQRLLAAEPQHIQVKRYIPGLTAEQLDTIDSYVRLKIGTSYSVWEALKVAPILKRPWTKDLKINTSKSSSLQFCSRLVADAYKRADVNLVCDSFSCTPVEIFENPDLASVEGAVIKLSENQIEFARDVSRDKIKIQTNITKALLSEARKFFGETVQTLNDLETLSVQVDGADEIIAHITAKSGYLELWRNDIKDNPWRYDQDKFEAFISHQERPHIVKRELGMAQRELKRYRNSLYNCKVNYSTYPTKTIYQRVQLYETLVALAEGKVLLFSKY